MNELINYYNKKNRLHSKGLPQGHTIDPKTENDKDDTAGTINKNIGHFILGEKLGEGTFGVVRIATHILTNEKVAVKILNKKRITEKSDKTRIEREIKILKLLHHNNIIQLYSVIQTSTTIYLIMEYANGKELFDYINSKKKLKEPEACKFFQQIISGIEYLHKLKIAHRDLKPENLLLNHNKDIKIVDFGLSNLYTKNQLLSTACGSPCYAPPEMINGNNYKGHLVDIWSSGVILFAMLCGYLPFEDVSNDKLYKKITEGKFVIPSCISEHAQDLIRKILVTDPSKRYGFYEIKTHPWFNSISPKLNINEGLLIKKVVIPIDEELVNKMKDYDYNKKEIRENIIMNKHNHLTTLYYLLLLEKVRNGKKSIADLKSDLFLGYIRNVKNSMKEYGYDIDKVIKERAEGVHNVNNGNSSSNSNSINNNNINSKHSVNGISSDILPHYKLLLVEGLNVKERHHTTFKTEINLNNESDDDKYKTNIMNMKMHDVGKIKEKKVNNKGNIPLLDLYKKEEKKESIINESKEKKIGNYQYKTINISGDNESRKFRRFCLRYERSGNCGNKRKCVFCCSSTKNKNNVSAINTNKNKSFAYNRSKSNKRGDNNSNSNYKNIKCVEIKLDSDNDNNVNNKSHNALTINADCITSHKYHKDKDMIVKTNYSSKKNVSKKYKSHIPTTITIKSLKKITNF